MTTGASAPGKLMLAGEYAVLEGYPAVAAAVDRRAYARWSVGPTGRSTPTEHRSPETGKLPPECEVALGKVEEQLGHVQRALSVDVSALRCDGKKIGLGSSAAGCAAATAAVFAAHGMDVEDARTRQDILRHALAAHATVAPHGSGVDVRTSVLGGVLCSSRDDARPIALPAVHTAVVWVGQEARTSELVNAVRALSSRDPSLYASAIDRVGQAADRFRLACERQDASALVAATNEHHRALAELGRVATVPIVTERLERVSVLAQNAAGAAKPSGAGGGDVAVAFFETAANAEQFESACRAEGLTLISVRLGAPGVRAASEPSGVFLK